MEAALQAQAASIDTKVVSIPRRGDEEQQLDHQQTAVLRQVSIPLRGDEDRSTRLFLRSSSSCFNPS